MLSSGTRFGRYELQGELGRGGFAAVYRARDTALGRVVALKLLYRHLADNPELRQRFLAEASAIARLRHANVVTIYDVGEVDGQPYFTMELIDGLSLAQTMADGSGLPLTRTMQILQGLAAAIDYVHGAGLVHRDIKPANIMLDAAGQLVLMDFGIARSLDGAQITSTGISLGTPHYMSPEQVLGRRAGPPADIYALGILTYQMLAGRPPFVGDSMQVMHAQAYEPPTPLQQLRSDLPAPVYAAIAAALAKEPAARPASATDFVAAMAGNAPTTPLQTVISPRPGPRGTGAERAATDRKRSGAWLWFAAGGALLVVAGAAAALLLSQQGRNQPQSTPVSSRATVSGTTTALPVSPTATAPAAVITSAPSTAQGTTAPAATVSRPTPPPSVAPATPLPAMPAPATPVPPTPAPVSPTPRAPTPPPDANARTGARVQTIGVTADDAMITRLSVDRAELLPTGELLLTLSFVIHGGIGWSADVASDTSIFLSDERGQISHLREVSGPATVDNRAATTNVGSYRFEPPPQGTRWVWLHYGTSRTQARSLIVGFDLGAAAPGGASSPATTALQSVGASGHDQGCCQVNIHAAQGLDGGSVRLLLFFIMEATHKWQGDNRPEFRTTIYLEDDRARRANLVETTGPSANDDATALTNSGWYRFAPLAAGVQRVRLHYGDAVIDVALGVAAP